jgi:hypothetical protein
MKLDRALATDIAGLSLAQKVTGLQGAAVLSAALVAGVVRALLGAVLATLPLLQATASLSRFSFSLEVISPSRFLERDARSDAVAPSTAQSPCGLSMLPDDEKLEGTQAARRAQSHNKGLNYTGKLRTRRHR